MSCSECSRRRWIDMRPLLCYCVALNVSATAVQQQHCNFLVLWQCQSQIRKTGRATIVRPHDWAQNRSSGRMTGSTTSLNDWIMPRSPAITQDHRRMVVRPSKTCTACDFRSLQPVFWTCSATFPRLILIVRLPKVAETSCMIFLGSSATCTLTWSHSGRNVVTRQLWLSPYHTEFGRYSLAVCG